MVGANSGALSLSSGGSVDVGSGNTANIAINGSSTTLGINGNTSGTISLNSGSALSLNGSNTGTIQVNGGSLNYTGSQGNVTNVNGGTVTQVSILNVTAPGQHVGQFRQHHPGAADRFVYPVEWRGGEQHRIVARRCHHLQR